MQEAVQGWLTPSVLFVFVNLTISVIFKLMSVTAPENGGDWHNLMRALSVTFDHFCCFSFSQPVRVRRRRCRHTSRRANRWSSPMRAAGTPKMGSPPPLFRLMVVVLRSSSTPPLRPPLPPSPSLRWGLEGEEVSVMAEVSIGFSCVLQFVCVRGSRKERIQKEVCYNLPPPLSGLHCGSCWCPSLLFPRFQAPLGACGRQPYSPIWAVSPDPHQQFLLLIV
jgi:hypothetical protein